MQRIIAVIFILMLSACKTPFKTLTATERAGLFCKLPSFLCLEKRGKVLSTGRVFVWAWEDLKVVDVAEGSLTLFFNNDTISVKRSDLNVPLGVVSLTYKVSDTEEDLMNFIEAFDGGKKELFITFLETQLRHLLIVNDLGAAFSDAALLKDLNGVMLQTLQEGFKRFGVEIRSLKLEEYYDSAALAKDREALKEVNSKIMQLKVELARVENGAEDDLEIEKIASERELEEARRTAQTIKAAAARYYKFKADRSEVIRESGKLKNQALQEIVSLLAASEGEALLQLETEERKHER